MQKSTDADRQSDHQDATPDLAQKLHAIAHGGDRCAYGGASCVTWLRFSEELSRVRADAAPREQELSDTEALLRLKAELLESAEKECDELAVYLREMMRVYEQRIRSDCTPAQLKQKPWRVAEYVAAEEALAARAVLAGEEVKK